MRYSPIFSVFFILATAGTQALAEPAEGPLSLAEATQRVLKQHPQIQAATALMDAAAGRTQQAGTLPNPEMGYLVEDFSGDTSRSLGDGTTTLSLSQRFSLPGKRGSRIEVAEAEQKEAGLSWQAQKLALIRMTRETYAEALAAGERQGMAEDSLRLALQLYEAVAARVEAGKVSPIERSRADVSLAAAERNVRLAIQQHQLAKRSLASLWGEATLMHTLTTSLDIPASLPPTSGGLDHSPALRQLQAQTERQRAALALAKAGSLPDITLSAGMKREAMTRDQSLQVGVSLPLPLFDRNQGERRSARGELLAAEATLQAELAELGREQDRLLSEREAAYYEAVQLRDGVLKTAAQALDGTREGYRAGKFSLLELLDAQRALIEARNAFLSARLSYQKSEAALDELVGRDTFSEVNP